jgi:hypothetical protein
VTVDRFQFFRLVSNEIPKQVSTAAVKRYKPQATSISPTPTHFSNGENHAIGKAITSVRFKYLMK